MSGCSFLANNSGDSTYSATYNEMSTFIYLSTLMLNREQASYIDNLRTNYPGLDIAQLTTTLQGSNWSQAEITEAVARYNGVPATSVSPPTLPVVETSPASAVTPPVDPVFAPSSVSQPSHKSLFLVIGIVLFLLLLGGVAFAFMKGVGPFDKKAARTNISKQSFLAGVFTRLGNVQSSSYELAGDIAVKPREADAVPFGNQNPDSSTLLPYQRDQDRFRDLEKIKNALPREDLYGGQYWDGKKYVKKPVVPLVYPMTLSALNLPTGDALGIPYEYKPSPDKKDFSLTVKFETIDAYKVATMNSYAYSEPSLDDSSSVAKNDPKTLTVHFTRKNFNVYASSFSGKPKTPSLFGMSDFEGMLQYMPTELVGHLGILGTFARKEESLPDGQFQIVANGSFGDASMSFDAELLKKASLYYGRLNKSPDILGSTGKIRGKWIKFSEDDLRANGYLGDSVAEYLPSDASKQEEMKKTFYDALTVILKVADEEKALIQSAPDEATVVDGKNQVIHHLALDRNTLVPFYKRVIEELKTASATNMLGEVKFDQSVVDYLESDEFKTSYDYLARNNTFTIWTDELGFPVKVSYHLRVIPSDQVINMKGKQFELTLSAMLKNINAPIEVKEPETSISFEDMMAELTGKTKEELRFERQTQNVDSIRYALTNFKEITGMYPANLSDLTKKRKDLPRKVTSTSNSVYERAMDETTIIRSLPIDNVTGKPFVYQTTNDGYQFKYSISLPPYREGMNTFMIFNSSYDYSYQTGGETKSKFNMNVINGVNTANEKVKSAEAASGAAQDTDGDGLPDAIEGYIGTNPKLKDTDGDSYSDGDELSSGSNPRGPGRMKTGNAGMYGF